MRGKPDDELEYTYCKKVFHFNEKIINPDAKKKTTKKSKYIVCSVDTGKF